MARGRVVDVDRGYAAMMRRARALQGAAVRIGVLEAKGRAPVTRRNSAGEILGGGSAFTMVALASVHEFGSLSANVPERSFLRTTFDDQRARYHALMRRVLRLYIIGRIPLRSALGLVGLQFENDVRARIRGGLRPGLAASTLRARRRRGKGNRKFAGHKPLIDTGRLIGSISHEVKT